MNPQERAEIHKSALDSYFMRLTMPTDYESREVAARHLYQTVVSSYFEDSNTPLPDSWQQYTPPRPEYRRSRRIGDEQFALFPLRALASTIEWNYLVQEAGEWYENVGREILTITPQHTADCINAEAYKSAPDRCQTSFYCPRRILRSLLIDGGLEPDFSSFNYSYDGLRQFKLTRRKLQAAESLELASQAETEAILQSYTKKAERAFSAILD